jgi:hypothetical protein
LGQLAGVTIAEVTRLQGLKAGMHRLISMERITRLRRRLAIEVDSAITAVLSRLLDKETEKSAIAIQKEMDKRDSS